MIDHAFFIFEGRLIHLYSLVGGCGRKHFLRVIISFYDYKYKEDRNNSGR